MLLIGGPSNQNMLTKYDNTINLRELLATSVILGMCAGRWGRNGSSERRINPQKLAKTRCQRDRSLTIALVPAADPLLPSLPSFTQAKLHSLSQSGSSSPR